MKSGNLHMFCSRVHDALSIHQFVRVCKPSPTGRRMMDTLRGVMMRQIGAETGTIIATRTIGCCFGGWPRLTQVDSIRISVLRRYSTSYWIGPQPCPKPSSASDHHHASDRHQGDSEQQNHGRNGPFARLQRRRPTNRSHRQLTDVFRLLFSLASMMRLPGSTMTCTSWFLQYPGKAV